MERERKRMRRMRASRLYQTQAAGQGNDIFARIRVSMLERPPGTTPASANVSKLGAAVIRAGRTASALARGLTPAWVCVIFPTLAFAQTGETSIGVGLLP